MNLKKFKVILCSLITILPLANFNANAAPLLQPKDPTKATFESPVSAHNVSYDFLGKGLRRKKVFVVHVDVYNIFMYVPTGSKIDKTMEGSWASLSSLPSFAMKIEFLRYIQAGRIETSFRDSLKKNDISSAQPHFEKLLKSIVDSGDFEKHEAIDILGEKLNDKQGTERITLQRPSKSESTVIEGPKGFHKEFLAIWFGKSADKGLDVVKKGILGIP